MEYNFKDTPISRRDVQWVDRSEIRVFRSDSTVKDSDHGKFFRSDSILVEVWQSRRSRQWNLFLDVWLVNRSKIGVSDQIREGRIFRPPLENFSDQFRLKSDEVARVGGLIHPY